MTAQHAAAPRKSALRVAGNPPPRRPAAAPGEPRSGKALRAMMISEFGQWLRSRTNKYDRPFAEETVTAYKVAAWALDAWMTRQKIEEDFSVCDTPMLNRFFRDCHAGHGQSGTNTKQRNLRHLFTWLAEEYGQTHPYTTKLNRYAPVMGRPVTLSVQFITDLLHACGNGKARNFEDARDYALLRILCEGARRTEVTQMQLSDLPADLVEQPLIRVVPLKGARGQHLAKSFLCGLQPVA